MSIINLGTLSKIKKYRLLFLFADMLPQTDDKPF
jgi:hypothetical protein